MDNMEGVYMMVSLVWFVAGILTGICIMLIFACIAIEDQVEIEREKKHMEESQEDASSEDDWKGWTE